QQMLFVDALDQTTPVTDVTMKLCGPLDPTCSSPKACPTCVPDGMGIVKVPYPSNSGYYLDITNNAGAGGNGPGTCTFTGATEPGPPDAYRHSLAYLGDPITIPPVEKTIRMVTNDALCTLAQSIGTVEEM